MKTDALYVLHILDAITRIETYLAARSQTAFFQDLMLQDAVIRQLEIIGEASRRLSASFRQMHATLPWEAIIEMRDRIAHDYINISLHVVWDVYTHDLPGLKAYLEQIAY